MSERGEVILLVEDDARLGALLSDYLRSNGFDVRHETHGTRALESALADPPAAIVLDLMLPGTSGLDVLRALRPSYRGGVLILTANKAQVDEVVGLELGADDYVTKPIEPRILLARVRSLLRRVKGQDAAEPPRATRLELGALDLDRSTRSARVSGSAVELTGTEFELLWLLVERAGEVVSRDELYLKVLKVPYDGIDRGVDVHVSRVRKKLGDRGFDGAALKSIRGAGYLVVKG